jgi:hypothetical protein
MTTPIGHQWHEIDSAGEVLASPPKLPEPPRF